jgi:putative ABC transport system permease protein
VIPAILGDIRAAVLGFRRRPLHPIMTVAILTLGLCAAVTAFTYFHGFSQPFPGADADRLVRVLGVEQDDPYQDISYLDFVDYAAGATREFEGIAAAAPFYAASVRREAMTEVAFLEAVTGNYFAVLRVGPALGRAIVPADDRPGAPPVAVLSYRWWRRSFGGDPSIIGQTVLLNFRPFTVIGVASPAFLGTTSNVRPDVWIPTAPFRDRYVGWATQAEDRDRPLVRVFGRLRHGVGRERGATTLGTLAAGLDDLYPRRTTPRRVRLEPATWIDARTRVAEMPTVRVMLLAAAGLLLLVCANVVNLLLAVSTRRLRELAVRATLGATPGRLLRSVLIENVLLSLIAGGGALALAVPASARLGSYFARPSVWGEHVPRETTIDWRVVAFALAASVAVGLAAGLLPALRASRRQLAPILRSDAASGTGRQHRLLRVQDVLVSSQVALSVVLLVVAGLVLRTLASVGRIDPGFDYRHVVASHISTSSTGVQVAERDRFFRELARRLTEEPWVRAATIADNVPLSPQNVAALRPEGQPDPVPVTYSRVIPGFFETLGISVLEGRSFAVGDTANAPDVAIVNRAFADRFFAEQRAVGRRIWWPATVRSVDRTFTLGQGQGADREFEVIGVVRNAKAQDLFAVPEPVVYFSYPQHSYPSNSGLIVATRTDPASAVPRLQAWLRHYEPHLAIINVLPYTAVLQGFRYTQRMNAQLFATLASLGLAVAAVGIFGVVSLAVARRTREFGIRAALGAERADLRRMVLRQALTPVIVGVAVGVAGAVAATGLVRSLLYGVRPTDPVTLVAGGGVLVAIALLAAYGPAHRATAVNPVAALRAD